jgi:hypothetical protein
MLTAPHGLKVWRGGKAHGDRRRVHLRERYITEIVLKLALRVEAKTGVPCSFVCWNMKTAVDLDKNNKDPNYLLEEQFDDSPWHAALVRYDASNIYIIFSVATHMYTEK